MSLKNKCEKQNNKIQDSAPVSCKAEVSLSHCAALENRVMEREKGEKRGGWMMKGWVKGFSKRGSDLNGKEEQRVEAGEQ